MDASPLRRDAGEQGTWTVVPLLADPCRTSVDGGHRSAAGCRAPPDELRIEVIADVQGALSDIKP